MKKSSYILLAVTAAILIFFLGFYAGRNAVDGQVNVFVETTPESIGKININTATIDELMLIPGINEIMAQRIVDYRTRKGHFESVDDLCNISGISTRKLDEIRDLLRVE